MTRLILVKHSTPAIIESVPAREWRLSEAGRIRAGQLAGWLRLRQPHMIISSLEPKAQETAEILARQLGLDHRSVSGLHEHDRRNSPYYSTDEFQELIREFFERPTELVFGKETAGQSLARFSTAVNHVLKTFTERTIAIVTHGTVIALFVAQLTGQDGYSLWRELGLPSFVTLDLQSRKLLETVNLP